jgi:hypothetical protein
MLEEGWQRKQPLTSILNSADALVAAARSLLSANVNTVKHRMSVSIGHRICSPPKIAPVPVAACPDLRSSTDSTVLKSVASPNPLRTSANSLRTSVRAIVSRWTTRRRSSVTSVKSDGSRRDSLPQADPSRRCSKVSMSSALRTSAIARLAAHVTTRRRSSVEQHEPLVVPDHDSIITTSVGGARVNRLASLAIRFSPRGSVAIQTKPLAPPKEPALPSLSPTSLPEGGMTRTEEEDYDAKFYSAEMLRKRARLRWDAAIRRESTRLWRAAKHKKGRMERKEYLDFHLSIYHWLMNKEGGGLDERDALQAGQEDWESDVQAGFTSMSYENFVLCLFELADLWVASAAQRDYVLFLRELFLNVTMRDARGRRTWRHRWPRGAGTGTDGGLVGDILLQGSILTVPAQVDPQSSYHDRGESTAYVKHGIMKKHKDKNHHQASKGGTWARIRQSANEKENTQQSSRESGVPVGVPVGG